MQWSYPCSKCKKIYKKRGWAVYHQQQTGHLVHHELIISADMLTDSKFDLTPEVKAYLDSLPKEPVFTIPVPKAERLALIGTINRSSRSAIISGLLMTAEKKVKESGKRD